MANVIDSEAFLAFSTYATIVILKMMFMGPLTGYFRFTRKVTEVTHLSCMSLFWEQSMEYFKNIVFLLYFSSLLDHL